MNTNHQNNSDNSVIVTVLILFCRWINQGRKFNDNSEKSTTELGLNSEKSWFLAKLTELTHRDKDHNWPPLPQCSRHSWLSKDHRDPTPPTNIKALSLIKWLQILVPHCLWFYLIQKPALVCASLHTFSRHLEQTLGALSWRQTFSAHYSLSIYSKVISSFSYFQLCNWNCISYASVDG